MAITTRSQTNKLPVKKAPDAWKASTDGTASRPKKQVKLSRVETKDSRASTTFKFSLPVELVYEISGYLTLTGLLHLSRVSKFFHDILWSRGSAHVWKLARRHDRVSFPPCPDDIAEPFWVDLLLGGPNCQVCLKDGVKTVTDFEHRRRVCASCRGKTLVQEERAFDLGPDIMRCRMELLPKVHHGPGYRPNHYLRQDVLTLQVEVQNIEDEEDNTRVWEMARSLMVSLEHSKEARMLQVREAKEWIEVQAKEGRKSKGRRRK
ncbi:uncharacterized protein STEHIDRAFT_142748 [Stereum hirsutum FP-91666 SS1]|uniref:uncharacterized protein n=1 Tax=Stereum hirsutum (strain FP-91666) TaxID=721885 RepID=UPI0004449F80|nr:uncharacterized protein STEHIDRAFT_142748 [Stereum hirsutum FP-91666 SS1]EIM80907.1 hypothetical protein STEHIDRAFT_142748 [Stereum hirsutum FP-91666 SS1]